MKNTLFTPTLSEGFLLVALLLVMSWFIGGYFASRAQTKDSLVRLQEWIERYKQLREYYGEALDQHKALKEILNDLNTLNAQISSGSPCPDKIRTLEANLRAATLMIEQQDEVLVLKTQEIIAMQEQDALNDQYYEMVDRENKRLMKVNADNYNELLELRVQNNEQAARITQMSEHLLERKRVIDSLLDEKHAEDSTVESSL